MDLGGEESADVVDADTEQQSDPNISDVLQAIEAADPERALEGATASAPVNMFGGNMLQGPAPPAPAAPTSLHHNTPYCVIREQPAPKALRFRYECEGRSAGSIPGANSTPENKTFPTIEVVGYRGPAVVVVSCVTVDRPHKPHPHNLVGKDLCKDGVCTTKINPETMQVTFNNLGIQCIKKKDIEEALTLRERIRVDPFRTGFEHKKQTQSIDLNSVRLCFQVFLEKDRRFNKALAPVVSDIIYDKKAMSDLTICRMSHCAASVVGGQEVFLLCEKVAKDDIAVRMFELNNEKQEVWSAKADHLVVHKQVAIVFRTPRYHNLQADTSIQAYVQLQKLSDPTSVSEPRPFELKPMTGSINLNRKRNILDLLSDKKLDPNNNNPERARLASSDASDITPSDSGSANISDSLTNGNIAEDLRESLTSDPSTEYVQPPEKSLDDLLDQVAELDEIYSENRTRLEKISALGDDRQDVDMDDFNDAGTYTSLQLAFKNPIDIVEPELSYEDVQTHRGPIIEYTPLKRDDDDYKAPPLPPKRVRKTPSVETIKMTSDEAVSLLKPSRIVPLSRSKPDLSASEPALPPLPRKKRSFLSRLFRRRNKTPPPDDAGVLRGEAGRRARPVGRSVSSVSGQRPSKFKVAVSHASLKDDSSHTGLSYADSVTHISLHGDDDAAKRSGSTHSLRRAPSGPAPPLDDDTILVAETVLALSASDFKKLQDDLDLTEAEHYALYMAVAPHATVSEFDETSCYYSPVDGDRFQHQS